MKRSEWELRSNLSWKDAAISTGGIKRSSVNYLCRGKWKYSRDLLRGLINENTLVDSFFFRFDLFASLFFPSVCIFCILSYFEIDAFWNHWSPLQLIFCWKRTEKRKLEKCFFGARVWALRLVYRSPKQPKYVTVHCTRPFTLSVLIQNICCLKWEPCKNHTHRY